MHFSCLGTTNQESVNSFGLLTATPAKSKIELILERKKSETSPCIRKTGFNRRVTNMFNQCPTNV